jgi:hypothetical protein
MLSGAILLASFKKGKSGRPAASLCHICNQPYVSMVSLHHDYDQDLIAESYASIDAEAGMTHFEKKKNLMTETPADGI